MYDYDFGSFAYQDYSYYDRAHNELSGLKSTCDSLTKDYSASQMYMRIFDKYIASRSSVSPNDRNNKASEKITEVLDEYYIVDRKFKLFLIMLEPIDSMIFRQWKDILLTNDEFSRALRRCLSRLKRYGITDMQSKAISHKINCYRERMTRIIDYIYPEYIKFTPFYEYKDGENTFDDLLTDTVVLNDDLDISDEFFKFFAESIVESMDDSEEYIARLMKYKNMIRDRKIKEQEWREICRRKHSIEAANKRLSFYTPKVRKYFSVNAASEKVDRIRLEDLRKKGVTTGKLLMVTPIAGQSSHIFFISNTGEFVTGVKKAWIFKETDPIPPKVQSMVDSGAVAMLDMTFEL